MISSNTLNVTEIEVNVETGIAITDANIKPNTPKYVIVSCFLN